jgi:hypothetical protein
MSEFETYQSVYCGLCKQLGEVFGPFAKFTLSYDFTFVAVLSLALSKECQGFKKSVCAANPLKKKTCLKPCDDLTFSASAAMIMFYYKLLDNIQDNGVFSKLGCYMLLPFAKIARRKSIRLYPKMDIFIGESMTKQIGIEKSDNPSIDLAADPTATALAKLCEMMSDEPTTKRILNRFGYLLGKWVYLIDALDDFEQDLKDHGFNPYAKKLEISEFNEENYEIVKSYAEQILNLTVTELANAYELLKLNRYKEILDNVIYLGLKNTQKQLLSDKEENEPL